MAGGRPRKPSALRVIEGMRGHRPLPRGEPQPRVGVPEMPDLVAGDPAAAAYWSATAKTLGAVTGWITHDMERQLADYALLRARRDRLYRVLRELGETYEAEFIHDEGKDNETLVRSRKPQPEARLLKEILVEIRNLESAMGIGPVYKAKLDLFGHDDAQDDVLEG